MTCTAPNGLTALVCPRSVAAAAAIAVAVFGAPHAMTATKDWVAGTLHVHSQDYSWGQLISLKGAVENGDPFRATRIMVEAGQRPDPLVWQPSLTGLYASDYLGF